VNAVFSEWLSLRATFSTAAIIGTVRSMIGMYCEPSGIEEVDPLVVDPVRKNSPAIVDPSNGSFVTGVGATLVTPAGMECCKMW